MRISRIRFAVTVALVAAVAAFLVPVAGAAPVTTPVATVTTSAAELPAARIIAGPAGLTNDRRPTFAVAGDDVLECSLVSAASSADWQPCAGGTYTPGALLDDGAFVFAARSSGPLVTGPADTRPFTVDATPPVVPTVQAPADGALVTGAPTFAFAGEPGATLSCSLDDGPFAPCAPGPTFAFASDGSHALRVRATDAAGNVGDPSATTRFAVDASAPTVQVISPSEQETVARGVRVTYQASEQAVSYRCRIDLGRFAPCGDGSHTFRNLPPGLHRFRVVATDRVGHEGPVALRTFRVAASDEDGPFIEPGSQSDAGALGARGSTLRLAGVSMRVRQRRTTLRRRGLRIAVVPAAGTSIVRVRVRRAGSRRTLFTRFRTVRGTRRQVLVLRGRAIARLRPGRYRIELTPGRSRRVLGVASTWTVTVGPHTRRGR